MTSLIFLERLATQPPTAPATRPSVWIRLPHPRTGELVYFTLRPDPPHLLEIQRVDNDGCSSWFIDDSVQKGEGRQRWCNVHGRGRGFSFGVFGNADGSLYTASPMDPLFVLLPLLDARRKQTDAAAGQYISLDDLLFSEEYRDLSRIGGIEDLADRLAAVCDTTSPTPDLVCVRLNDEKVVRWMKAKCQRILENFDNYELLDSVRSGEEGLEVEQIKTSRLRVAIRLLSEYLRPCWVEKLQDAYGLKNAQDANDGFVYFDNVLKRPAPKTGSAQSGADAKKAKLTPGQRSLAKANREGMKSITSFFKK
ncbi:ribonuclease H2, subunit B [Fimicolochytrium jonesii]|uniref:ribonuclease H2, subunit B n=1 Tax=Fimicolochytrium jonesii TaxID=1396493 RepID=UPI0022FE841C|nr:ribonuclease H2, subunit B [Fimicolochytrium jonesii]KAI8822392.1 ribonuclease H2, subunit B [Fimicolochytrium jonesii]